MWSGMASSPVVSASMAAKTLSLVSASACSSMQAVSCADNPKGLISSVVPAAGSSGAWGAAVGSGVAVGGMGVAVGGTGVAVGGTGVGVGGIGVGVGGTGVAVGGTGVGVGGTGVGVGSGDEHATIKVASIAQTNAAIKSVFAFPRCNFMSFPSDPV